MSSVQLVSVVLVLLALLLDSGMSLVLHLPKDCSDIYNHDNSRPSGVYTIYPIGSTSAVQTGFGNAFGEYWLGLENLSHLTLRKKYELLVDMEDFEGGKVFAWYSSFSVAPESSGFTLHVSGFTDGGAGDSLSYHNGSKFSTFDKDQDSDPTSNCARSYLGAFWYSTCHYTNPNGVYRWGADGTIHAIGVSWEHWKGYDYSLKSISMKVRPVQ
ncbi:Microfibril-associated glycoprotein 4 [Dissostichus eleginoides]|uniref:Microfibril-associated glycoprotein 4 n=1 Tax=Dissostichus eleginoides TaxID=100907 RepID=A0AAD9BD18_DISEL|nr:Microfibril-associated glycoprotein 4 [Dissostichus eleginoides]